jgi:glycosyltransferase involved in cell wall biosynthesis
MKIAQVSPLFESVPPKYYGGTERVVSYLTEELVKMGHDVTLYASGDSVTNARLKAVCHRALRLDKYSIDPVADHVLLSQRLYDEAGQYDFIHSHIDYISYPLMKLLRTPNVTTLHGRLDIPNLYNLYKEFADINVISISDFQRTPLPWINWQATVYHGLPEDLYEFHEEPEEYLAFIGRITPEKRVDSAIEIAKKSGMKLKIAAKVDNINKKYFNTCLKPFLNEDDIEFLGEIGESEKNDFLGNAYALLFPIDWPEPFGLVMIEAMACGTPIIARLQGSVPEIMEHSITGFVVKNTVDAVKAVKEVGKLKRKKCREIFEAKFTSRRMAENYLQVYEKIIGRG